MQRPTASPANSLPVRKPRLNSGACAGLTVLLCLLSTALPAAEPAAVPQRAPVVVVGSGITGLCAGALLARQGYAVTVLEQHPTLLGGHARTLQLNGVEVCAGPQYVWSFAPGEPGWQVLKRLGLEQQVPFDPFDPDAFDRLIVDDVAMNVPVGLKRWRAVCLQQFPADSLGLLQFFATLEELYSATRFLNDSGLYLAKKPAMMLGMACTPTLSLRTKLLTLLYSEKSLGDLFDDCHLSSEVRRFLYGQGGLFALPDQEVSVITFAAAIGYYHGGPQFPRYGFRSLIDGLCQVIRDESGAVLLGKKVVELVIQQRRVVSVRCADGSEYPATIVLSTLSPRLTAGLIPGAPIDKLNYQPSNSPGACYFKIVDYPELRTQLRRRNVWWQTGARPVDYDSPDMTAEPALLFVCSPTANGVGSRVNSVDSLAVYAPGNFDQSAQAAATGGAALTQLRDQFAESCLTVLERELFPGIRDHIETRHVLTPWDIREELGAERGNVYGRRLDAWNILRSETATPYADNLHVVNSSMGLPGVAIAFQTANHLVPPDRHGVVPIPLVILRGLILSVTGKLRQTYLPTTAPAKR